jgi:hypothetical protein
MGVFEEEKVGVRPAKSMAVEPNSRRPFLLKYRLLKVVVLIPVKITLAWPKNKGDATPYQAMDKFMKYLLVYFVQVFFRYYGGFKVRTSPLAASSSILTC